MDPLLLWLLAASVDETTADAAALALVSETHSLKAKDKKVIDGTTLNRKVVSKLAFLTSISPELVKGRIRKAEGKTFHP